MTDLAQQHLAVLRTIYGTTLDEIAARTGLPRTKLHRILHCEVLVDAGTVARIEAAIVGRPDGPAAASESAPASWRLAEATA